MPIEKPTTWPSAPIEFVSHGGPGSGPHLMMSALAESFVQAGCPATPSIEALPGNDGGDAISRVAHAGAASVLSSCTPSFLTTPIVFEMPETWDTLTPIAGLVADTYLIVVAATHPAESMVELLASPTAVGVPKSGGNTDIQAMLIRDATEATVTTVVERDKVALMAGLLGGRVDWTTGVYSDFEEWLSAGALRILGVFDGADSPQSLGTPLTTQGVEVTFPLWRGVIASGDASPEQVVVWESAIQAALAQEAWIAYLTKERQRQAYLSSSEFSALLAAEDQHYSAWVRELG